MNSQRRRASVKHQLSAARRSEDLPPLPLPPAPVVPAIYSLASYSLGRSYTLSSQGGYDAPWASHATHINCLTFRRNQRMIMCVLHNLQL